MTISKNSFFFKRIIVIAILLTFINIVHAGNYTNCTRNSTGSTCSSGCCYQTTATYKTCQSSASFCGINTSTSSTIDVGVIIGIAVGGFVFFILIIVCIVCCIKRAMRNAGESYIVAQQMTTVDLGNTGNQVTTTNIPNYPPAYGYGMVNPVNPINSMNQGYQMNPTYLMSSNRNQNMNINMQNTMSNINDQNNMYAASWNPNL